jgi:hypothetical protein
VEAGACTRFSYDWWRGRASLVPGFRMDPPNRTIHFHLLYLLLLKHFYTCISLFHVQRLLIHCYFSCYLLLFLVVLCVLNVVVCTNPVPSTETTQLRANIPKASL